VLRSSALCRAGPVPHAQSERLAFGRQAARGWVGRGSPFALERVSRPLCAPVGPTRASGGQHRMGSCVRACAAGCAVGAVQPARPAVARPRRVYSELLRSSGALRWQTQTHNPQATASSARTHDRACHCGTSGLPRLHRRMAQCAVVRHGRPIDGWIAFRLGPCDSTCTPASSIDKLTPTDWSAHIPTPEHP
jgi:hypothetical protein